MNGGGVCIAGTNAGTITACYNFAPVGGTECYTAIPFTTYNAASANGSWRQVEPAFPGTVSPGRDGILNHYWKYEPGTVGPGVSGTVRPLLWWE